MISKKITALIIFVLVGIISGQTKGKISGIVIDSDSKAPLPGANVVVEGTIYGAAADGEGRFFIINLPPGTYTLKTSVIGYSVSIAPDIRVSVNRTTNVDFEMQPTVIEGEEVIVQVSRIAEKKDQTSTTKNISSDDIEKLPVENLEDIVEMQAGIVAGHFRSGRDTEVTYMVDGIQVDDSFDTRYKVVDIEADAVQDLEVITGTFNAEYGRAMSGIVNAVTKDGGNEIEGSFGGSFGNYYTGNNDIFLGLKNSEFTRNQDYKVQLSGPIIKDKITFFTNFRAQDNKNHLNGIRRFNVTDFSFFTGSNPEDWISFPTGDSTIVSMNRSQNKSFMGKLSFKLLKGVDITTTYTRNEDEWYDYNHAFKFNPDGMAHPERVSNFYALSINHMLTERLFYDLKIYHIDTFNGYYVYKDPTSENYVSDIYFNNYGSNFFTGGQVKDHSIRKSQDTGIKFDMTWQIGQNHQVKWGTQYIKHNLDHQYHTILNKYRNTSEQDFLYEPEILPDTTIYADVYKKYPIEYSAYLQDKMEFDEMVINIGMRYDYFDPKTVYPSNRQNPANNLNLPDSLNSEYLNANPKIQISPRFGLAYQLGDVAVLHFSYGHFFQLPPLSAFYQNNAFLVAPSNYQTIMGNSELETEKTVAYEIGLWQRLSRNLGMEVSLYYKDIYNLLSGRLITTYNGIIYGLYSNKDYANVTGLEVKMNFDYRDFYADLNYTLQFTRGNADYALMSFDRAGNSTDPVNRYIPMSWDQRHTFNFTMGYNSDNYGLNLTGYYSSGTPYTYTPAAQNRLALVNLYPNNDYKIASYRADFTGFYKIKISEKFGLKITATVYNLLDRLNEEFVNNETGRAYTAIVEEIDILSYRSDFSTFKDWYENPAMFSAPRYAKIGLEITF